MFYDALHHQDMQPYNDLLYEQQCINCLAEESVARLRAGMLPCPACMKVLSAKQEAKSTNWTLLAYKTNVLGVNCVNGGRTAKAAAIRQ